MLRDNVRVNGLCESKSILLSTSNRAIFFVLFSALTLYSPGALSLGISYCKDADVSGHPSEGCNMIP